MPATPAVGCREPERDQPPRAGRREDHPRGDDVRTHPRRDRSRPGSHRGSCSGREPAEAPAPCRLAPRGVRHGVSVPDVIGADQARAPRAAGPVGRRCPGDPPARSGEPVRCGSRESRQPREQCCADPIGASPAIMGPSRSETESTANGTDSVGAPCTGAPLLAAEIGRRIAARSRDETRSPRARRHRDSLRGPPGECGRRRAQRGAAATEAWDVASPRMPDIGGIRWCPRLGRLASRRPPPPALRWRSACGIPPGKSTQDGGTSRREILLPYPEGDGSPG